MVLKGKVIDAPSVLRGVPPERLLADEMLGRLARYLRFVGLDTAYARGLTDDRIARWASEEGRVLLTRDRGLAARVPGAVRIRARDIAGQWRELRGSFSDLPGTVRFARGTRCNGEVRRVTLSPDAVEPVGAPVARIATGLPLYRCTACGHVYWSGTHTLAVQRALDRWAAESGR